MRKVFECFRCGFAWHSPWWEPTFVGRRMAVKEHEVMHDVSLANALSWKSGGAEAERERIIKLLDALATQEPDYAQVLIHNLKVLIKGENK